MVGFTAVLLLAVQTSLIYGQHNSNQCSDWWSIVKNTQVFDLENVKSPISVDSAFCTSLGSQGVLNSNQVKICQEDPKLLSTNSIGVLQALNTCHKVFANRTWNCSVFESGPYLGKFIQRGTRETAFLTAIVCAGVSREVARKCKQQDLKLCSCDFSAEKLPPDDTTTIISGCGDNCVYGDKVAKDFCKCYSTSSCVGQVANHNCKIGRQMVQDETVIECVCHGVSGSCSAQTCFKKVPDIQEIGEKLRTLYDLAQLAPPLPDQSTLAYCEYSPNFCKRDLEEGTYGSSGRQCWPNKNGPSSCSVMCCGGPVEQRRVKKEEKKCEFKWCCRIECKVIRTWEEIEYYCK